MEELVEEYVYRYHYKLFPVVEGSERIVGCVTTKQIKEIPREEWNHKTVREIAVQCSPENTIDPQADAVKALSVMNKNGASRLMVVEGDRLQGIISLKDMLQFLSLKIELEN